MLRGPADCAGSRPTITQNDTGISLKPDNDRAKLLLALALGSARTEKGEKVKGEGTPYKVSIGSGLGYEMREWFLKHLWPTAMSFVWDSVRRDVQTVWTSKDPEHPQASRGWLVMQGAARRGHVHAPGDRLSRGHGQAEA